MIMLTIITVTAVFTGTLCFIALHRYRDFCKLKVCGNTALSDDG